MASLFKVSRATVSKVFAHFAGEGLVERRQGSGTYLVETRRLNGSAAVAVGLRSVYNAADCHFLTLINGLSKHAESLNIHLQIFDRLTDQFEETPENNRLCQSLKSDLIQGVLIISRMPLEIVGRLLAMKTPLVIINNLLGSGEIPCVTCDYHRAGFLAADHLARFGHHRIGFIAEDFDLPDAFTSLSGFRCALDTHHLPLPGDAILETGHNDNVFCQRVRAYFQRSGAPTAFFVRTDSLASRLIRVLAEIGKRVPDDISLVGMSNYSWGIHCPVPLTTIDNRLDEMCRLGLKILAAAIQGKAPDRKVELLQPALVERDSVRKSTKLP